MHYTYIASRTGQQIGRERSSKLKEQKKQFTVIPFAIYSRSLSHFVSLCFGFLLFFLSELFLLRSFESNLKRAIR